MGLLTSFPTRTQATTNGGGGAIDDFWYTPFPGNTSLSGVSVTSETALAIATVYACIRILSQTVGMLPLQLMENVTEGGREVKRPSRNHPLWAILHDRPNNWQTSMEFRAMEMCHVLLRGNFYAEIRAGRRGFADQLIPLNPDRMNKVELMPDFTRRYTYQPENGREVIYSDDQIYHLMADSEDGIIGRSKLRVARDSFGATLAGDQYAGRFYSQNMTPKGIFTMPGTLSDEAMARLKGGLRKSLQGLGNAHEVPVLEQDLKWQTIGLDNQDAQFLESRAFQVEEIARWFGVPLFMLQHTEKSTTWGTGIEQMMLGYVTITLMPWLVAIERVISRDLILRPDRFFPKFNVDMLLRGDASSRAEAHRIAVITGWETRNEVRDLEDMNPLPGLDDPLVALNMATVDENGNVQQPEGRNIPNGPDMSDEPVVDDRAQMFAAKLARMAVRRETAAIGKIKRQNAGSEEALKVALDDFYAQHEDMLVRDLDISDEDASNYSLLAKNTPMIEEDKIASLVRLAMESKND